MEYKTIDFYCNTCKCSLHMSMEETGNPDRIVMDGLAMKCTRDKRVIRLKNYTEGRILAHATKDNKVFI